MIGTDRFPTTVRTNCRVSALVERPGPIASARLPFRSVAKRLPSRHLAETVPAVVAAGGSVMISGVWAATIGSTGSGVATVTSPAPERSAAQDDRTAAPLFPSDPATTR